MTELTSEISFVRFGDQQQEVARLWADGTTSYNWTLIEELSKLWTPTTTDQSVNIAKLLISLRNKYRNKT